MNKTVIIVAVICFLIGTFMGVLLLKRGQSAPSTAR